MKSLMNPIPRTLSRALDKERQPDLLWPSATPVDLEFYRRVGEAESSVARTRHRLELKRFITQQSGNISLLQ